jgi:hypothetical protein
MLDDGADNVLNAKAVTSLDVYELGVREVGQHEPTRALLDKVHGSDLVSLEVQKLVALQVLGLEQRTDPGDKRYTLVFKKPQCLVCAFMQIQGHFHSQIVR